MTSLFRFEIKNALGFKGRLLVNEGNRIMRRRFLSILHLRLFMFAVFMQSNQKVITSL